jgi:hypothetical protein
VAALLEVRRAGFTLQRAPPIDQCGRQEPADIVPLLALSLEDQTSQRTLMSRDVDQRALRSRDEAGGTTLLEPLLSLEATGAGGGQRRQIPEAGAA